MKKKASLLLILALSAGLIFARGQREESQPQGGQMGPQGKIVIYTSLYESVAESLKWTLQRQFPNCEIDFVYGGTGQIQAKIAGELANNQLGCDMLLVADPSYALELRALGALRPYHSPTAAQDRLAFAYDRDGYWYPVRVSNMILAYNQELNPKESLPATFYDFAHAPGLTGLIAMNNPLTSGTTLVALAALRDKYGYDYFDALGQQGVKIESGAAALGKLESGEYKMAMVLEEEVLKKQAEGVTKLQIIYPTDGAVMIPSTIMTIDNTLSANHNGRTAEIITEWFLGPEGQNAIVQGWMHSVRKNFLPLPQGAAATSGLQAASMPVNWEACYRERREIYDRFEESVTNRP